MKVGLFVTCLVDGVVPEVAEATVRVLAAMLAGAETTLVREL